MLQLKKKYSVREMVKDLKDFSYNSFYKHKEEYERHLERFWFYKKETSPKGRTYYTFTEQKDDYIPYRKYKKIVKNNVIKRKTLKVLKEDSRQTFANIERIIRKEKEIMILNYKKSTLIKYIGFNIKDLIKDGYVFKGSYQWCGLNKLTNKYFLLNEEHIKELRSYLHTTEEEDNLYQSWKDGEIAKEEYAEKVIEYRDNTYKYAINKYYEIYGYAPILVPSYNVGMFKEIPQELLDQFEIAEEG